MGKIVKHRNACIACDSSDGMQIYEDDTAFCFSCQKFFKAEEVLSSVKDLRVPMKTPDFKKTTTIPTVDEIKELPVKGFGDRALFKDICEFYDVHVGLDPNDGSTIKQHYYPYGDGFKCRVVDKKDFFAIGKCNKLFGQDKFNPGGKRLIITEGEIDCLSVAQA